MQYSKFGNVIRNIQNNLGNRALKIDLRSTVTVMIFYPINFAMEEEYKDTAHNILSNFVSNSFRMDVWGGFRTHKRCGERRLFWRQAAPLQLWYWSFSTSTFEKSIVFSASIIHCCENSFFEKGLT